MEIYRKFWLRVFAIFVFTANYAPAFAQGQTPRPAANVDYATAHLSRRLPAVRATHPVVIDGALNEEDWALAPMVTDFLQSEPRQGDPASEATDVRMLYDNQNLYIGVFAHDRDPHALIVSELKKDFNSDNGDAFEVVLDTFRDGRNGYWFRVNPAGAKSDAQTANEGREVNTSWDGVWFCKTSITELGWNAEIAIPFKTLKFNSADVQTWGVNFLRRIRRYNEDSTWAPLPRIFALSRVSMAGAVEDFKGLKPGKDLRLKPFALGSISKTGPAPNDGDQQYGFDVKYGVTSGLTWDFTVNTDFAQVEADEQQINLGRVSLFFPEKRDFFLENSGVFQFGVAGGAGGGGGGGGRQDNGARNDIVLFHSRQIGLSNSGATIPILAGTRLTGRAGKYSVGVLNMQQRTQGISPQTNFTALRVRRDVLAASDIGVMVLNKDPNGSSFDRVFGVDGNFRFFQNLNINLNAAKTDSPLVVRGRSTGDDTMLRAASNFRGKIYEYRASYAVVGDRFNDEMGYVPKVGINNAKFLVAPHLRLSWYPTWLREVWPHLEFSQVTRRSDNNLDSRYWDYHVPLTFSNGGSMEIGVNRSIEGLPAPFVLNRRVGAIIPAGRYTFNESFVMIRTNAAAPISYNIRYGTGNFYTGYRHNYQLGVTARVNEHLNVNPNYTRNVFTLPNVAGGGYTTDLLTARVNYSYSTSVFLNALVQYNTDAQQWSSNIRFNIIHRPLSDFFLVYNDTRDTRDLPDTLIGRSFIAKITYMMAF